MPASKATPHHHAQTPRGIQPRPTEPIPRETRPQRQQAADRTDEHGRQRRPKDGALARVQADAEGEEEEREAGGELDSEGVADGDVGGEEIAAAGLEGAGAVGGADEQAGQRAAGGLEGDVQGHAGEGGEAGGEGGEADGGVEVGAGDGREGVGEEGEGEPVGGGADDGADEGRVVEQPVAWVRRQREHVRAHARPHGEVRQQQRARAFHEGRFPELRLREAAERELLAHAHVRRRVWRAGEEGRVLRVRSVEHEGLVAAEAAGELDAPGEGPVAG